MNHEVNYYTGLTVNTPKKMSLTAQKEISKRTTLSKVMVVPSANIVIYGYFHVPSDTRPSDFIQAHKDDMTVLVDVTMNKTKLDNPVMICFGNCAVIQLLDEHTNIEDR